MIHTFRDIDSGRICFTDTGSGQPLLWIHGFCESKEIWNRLLPSFSGFRCITVDCLGYGYSSAGAGFDYSMRSQAQALLELLDRLEVYSCSWIGHSMGGYISLEVASLQPSLIQRLCLFHSTAVADNDERKENRNKTIKVVEENPELFIREFYYNLFAPDNKSRFEAEIEDFKKAARKLEPECIIGTLKGMRDRADHLETLKNLHVPKHYLIGKNDQLFPFDQLIDQASEVGASYSVLERSGHMGFLEQQAETAEALKNFHAL